MPQLQHKGTVTLSTDRLILRRFTTEDAEAMYRNWASRDEVTKYLTWPTHKTETNTKALLSLWVQEYRNPETYHWAITLKGSDEVVGDISVVHQEEKVLSMELGWCLSDALWGKGIMPEAAAAVRDFLFTEVGIHRLSAKHDSNNPKSGRVMEKIGMKHEGTLRQAGRNNQGLCDLEVYGMLREDWEKLCTRT